eukprot:NODE_47_length_32105_cov_1.240892.p10 type:complete len:308 gc:universal NODE_47_length_32105_cov_1.240892:26590-25667(-)
MIWITLLYAGIQALQGVPTQPTLQLTYSKDVLKIMEILTQSNLEAIIQAGSSMDQLNQVQLEIIILSKDSKTKVAFDLAFNNLEAMEHFENGDSEKIFSKENINTVQAAYKNGDISKLTTEQMYVLIRLDRFKMLPLQDQTPITPSEIATLAQPNKDDPIKKLKTTLKDLKSDPLRMLFTIYGSLKGLGNSILTSILRNSIVQRLSETLAWKKLVSAYEAGKNAVRRVKGMNGDHVKSTLEGAEAVLAGEEITGGKDGIKDGILDPSWKTTGSTEPPKIDLPNGDITDGAAKRGGNDSRVKGELHPF